MVYRVQQSKVELPDLIDLLFRYIINVIPKTDRNKVRTMLQKHLPEGETKEKFVSMGRGIWDDGRLEGKLEGIHKAKLEIVANAYKQGVALDIISKITGYSLQQLRQILNIKQTVPTD